MTASEALIASEAAKLELQNQYQNLCEFWNTNAKTSYTIILDSII
jgi:hypothetical protein